MVRPSHGHFTSVDHYAGHDDYYPLAESYITLTQLEAQGLGIAEEWRRNASSVPGAFSTGGDWLFPSSGLRAIGVQIGNFPSGEITDPDKRGPGEEDSSSSAER